MKLEKAVFTLFRGTSGVTELVSGREFSGVLPNPVVYPALVFQSGGRTREESIKGTTKLVREIFVIKSVMKGIGVTGFTTASAVDTAAELALNNFKGTVADEASPPDSMTIQLIRVLPGAHQYQWEPETQTHNFLSEFEATYLD